jgi:hypothetical protein
VTSVRVQAIKHDSSLHQVCYCSVLEARAPGDGMGNLCESFCGTKKKKIPLSFPQKAHENGKKTPRSHLLEWAIYVGLLLPI